MLRPHACGEGLQACSCGHGQNGPTSLLLLHIKCGHYSLRAPLHTLGHQPYSPMHKQRVLDRASSWSCHVRSVLLYKVPRTVQGESCKLLCHVHPCSPALSCTGHCRSISTPSDSRLRLDSPWASAVAPHRHTDTQTRRHTDTQTRRHADTHTHTTTHTHTRFYTHFYTLTHIGLARTDAKKDRQDKTDRLGRRRRPCLRRRLSNSGDTGPAPGKLG